MLMEMIQWQGEMNDLRERELSKRKAMECRVQIKVTDRSTES